MRDKRKRYMFMRTTVSVLGFVLWVFIAWSCLKSDKVDYEFRQGFDQIQSIRIVEGGDIDLAEGQFDQLKELAVIPPETWEVFIADFLGMQCHHFRNDPCYSFEETIIQVTYLNGCVEFVGEWGRFYYQPMEEKETYSRYIYFRSEEYDAFIAKYTQN